MVQLEICGRQQEQSQAPCKRAECQWLDSTRASEAWQSYKERLISRLEPKERNHAGSDHES